jgi:hypothetical protein
VHFLDGITPHATSSVRQERSSNASATAAIQIRLDAEPEQQQLDLLQQLE